MGVAVVLCHQDAWLFWCEVSCQTSVPRRVRGDGHFFVIENPDTVSLRWPLGGALEDYVIIEVLVDMAGTLARLGQSKKL
jgi:hypothetical protein